MITKVSSEKIVHCAMQECIRQGSYQLGDVAQLLQVYDAVMFDVADKTRLGGKYQMCLLPMFIVELGMRVEPHKNKNGFRQVPVAFGFASIAIPHDQIYTALESLIKNGGNLATNEWIHEFLRIHPFTDGNGRVAWVLQNAFNKTLNDPEPLYHHTF